MLDVAWLFWTGEVPGCKRRQVLKTYALARDKAPDSVWGDSTIAYGSEGRPPVAWRYADRIHDAASAMARLGKPGSGGWLMA